MASKFPILQSGFLSFNNPHLVASDASSPAAIATAIKLNKPIKSTGNTNFFHQPLDDLSNDLSRDYKLLKSFSFRKKYLLAIFDAFDHLSIKDWFKLQQSSPFYGSLHRRFIDETLSYVAGHQRLVDIQSWSGLLEPALIYDVDSLPPDKIDQYFSDSLPPGTGIAPGVGEYELKLPNKLTDFVAMWTSHPEGFEDLFMTAGIIFSRKRILNIGTYGNGE